MNKQVVSVGRVLRGMIGQGQARVLLCDTTAMAAESARIHEASPVCAAALGRGITASVLLNSASEKSENHLTMTIKGGGPAGALVVVANGNVYKAYVDNAQVQLPLKENGKLDVGGALGKNGMITVVRDLGMKEPYVGQCELQSGEIGDDVAYYCTLSEQQPTLCALGVRVAEEKVISAGGLLIQPLPGCSDDLLSALEMRAPVYEDISAHLLAQPVEELFEEFFRGLDAELLETQAVRYGCDCTRERMERVLLSLGRKELTELMEEQNGAEVNCYFCRTRHRFTKEDLQNLLAQAE